MQYQKVMLAANRVEAELIKGYLEAEGIRVIFRPSTEPYGGEAYFGDTGPLEILVPQPLAQKAKLIINDIRPRK